MLGEKINKVIPDKLTHFAGLEVVAASDGRAVRVEAQSKTSGMRSVAYNHCRSGEKARKQMPSPNYLTTARIHQFPAMLASSTVAKLGMAQEGARTQEVPGAEVVVDFMIR